jgi:hypothetical protein
VSHISASGSIPAYPAILHLSNYFLSLPASIFTFFKYNSNFSKVNQILGKNSQKKQFFVSVNQISLQVSQKQLKSANEV